MASEKSRVEYFRNRARQALEIAKRTRAADLKEEKEEYEKIAEDYERLAREVELGHVSL